MEISSTAARAALSLETRVSADTVPAFIWSTRPDNVVPVQNSLMFALALTEYDVPFEMHVYPKGGHGASLGNAIVGSGLRSISGWIDDSIRWMNSL
jgi:acetyl esterase/lipase